MLKTIWNDRKRNCLKLLITFLGAVVLFIYSGGLERIVDYFNAWQAERSLYFEPAEYGVLVCLFDGEKEYKDYISKDIVNVLNERFRELNLSTAIAKRERFLFLPNQIINHAEANFFGQKYNADIVIWGSVSPEMVFSHIRIVDTSDQLKEFSKKEFNLLKESLHKIDNASVSRRIDFFWQKPELTDEAFSLVMFSIARNYMENEKYTEAIKYFRKSLPLEKIIYIREIRKEPIYIQIAMCLNSIGDFEASESTILQHTHYQKNPDLLAFIGLLRNTIDSIPQEYHKQLANILNNSSPKNWNFLDQLFIYALTQKIVVKKSTRKTDNVDELIARKLTSHSKNGRSWKFLQLIYAQKQKDYEHFKKIYTELFEDAALEERVLLTLQAVSADDNLAENSINRIREENGIFPGLSLLEAFCYLSKKDYHKSKEIIEMNQVLKSNSILGQFIFSAYYTNEGEYEKALTYLDELIERLPAASLFRKIRGELNYYIHKTEAAEIDYKAYIKEYPADTQVLYRLSNLAAIREDTDGSVSYIQKMLECPRDNKLKFSPIIENLLANKSICKSYIFIDTMHEDQLNKVFDLMNSNDVESAKKKLLTIISESIDQNNNLTEHAQYVSFEFYVLSWISFLDNDLFAGYRYLLESYANYPTEETKNSILSVVDEIAGTEIFTKDVSTTLFSVAAKAIHSGVIDGNPSETAEYFETASKQYPSSCFLHVKAGDYRLRAKEFDKAAFNYQLALHCEPDMKSINRLYADIHVHFLKDPDCVTMITYYKRSLEIDGESVAAYDGLEQCYEKLGDVENTEKFHKKYKELYFKNGGNPLEYFFDQPLRRLQ